MVKSDQRVNFKNENFLILKSHIPDWLDFLIFFSVIISSHIFFVLKFHAITILLLLSILLLLKILNKSSLQRTVANIILFFFSFWLLEIKYPIIGYLFWPVDQFIGSLFFIVLSRLILKQKMNIDWTFRFSNKMIYSIFAIVLPSLFCLVLYYFFNKDVANQFPLPQLPIWSIPLVVFLMALINGLREELYFRFSLQSFLATNSSPLVAISTASVIFGYMHFSGGFPSGSIGVVLTSLFGILIGIQYYIFKSASLSWITHSITDAIMFTIILLNKS